MPRYMTLPPDMPFPMDKTSIKQWLFLIGKDRQWLADKLGITKRGVEVWLCSSNRPIPQRAQVVISNLMIENPIPEKGEQEHILGNRITLDAVLDSIERMLRTPEKILIEPKIRTKLALKAKELDITIKEYFLLEYVSYFLRDIRKYTGGEPFFDFIRKQVEKGES